MFANETAHVRKHECGHGGKQLKCKT